MPLPGGPIEIDFLGITEPFETIDGVRAFAGGLVVKVREGNRAACRAQVRVGAFSLRLREAFGGSRVDLADLFGLSETTLGRYETLGRHLGDERGDLDEAKYRDGSVCLHIDKQRLGIPLPPSHSCAPGVAACDPSRPQAAPGHTLSHHNEWVPPSLEEPTKARGARLDPNEGYTRPSIAATVPDHPSDPNRYEDGVAHATASELLAMLTSDEPARPGRHRSRHPSGHRSAATASNDGDQLEFPFEAIDDAKRELEHARDLAGTGGDCAAEVAAALEAFTHTMKEIRARHAA